MYPQNVGKCLLADEILLWGALCNQTYPERYLLMQILYHEYHLRNSYSNIGFNGANVGSALTLLDLIVFQCLVHTTTLPWGSTRIKAVHMKTTLHHLPGLWMATEIQTFSTTVAPIQNLNITHSGSLIWDESST